MTATTAHRTTLSDPLPSIPEGVGRRSAPDRLSTLWAKKWVILIATLLTAGLTFGATFVVPKTFSSSVNVGLNAPPVLGASVTDVANSANALAAQYAQVVTAESVLGPAASAAGTTSTVLRNHTSSGTLASQNVVAITVQADTPAEAESWANAIAASMEKYVETQGAAASTGYTSLVAAQLKPLDAQIATARERVDVALKALGQVDAKTPQQKVAATTAQLGSAQSLFTALTDRRASLVTQATLQSISLAPDAQILGGASAAIQIEPRPALYTIIAALIGLIVSAQIAVMLAERARRRSIEL